MLSHSISRHNFKFLIPSVLKIIKKLVPRIKNHILKTKDPFLELKTPC